MSTIIFQVQSILIVALLLYGVSKRKNRFIHMKIMKVAIIWDLLLVGQIEPTRSTITTASKALENPMILNIHISLAVSSVLLYAFVWYAGAKLNNGDEGKRKWHKYFALTALVTRVLTLITSFLIESQVVS